MYSQWLCMKLYGSLYITPGPGQGTRPIVPHCSGPGPCTCFGPISAQCEYIRNPARFFRAISGTLNSLEILSSQYQ